LGVAAAFLLACCTQAGPIRPTELPKLNDGFSEQVGTAVIPNVGPNVKPGSFTLGAVMHHSSVVVEKMDGTTFTVTGRQNVVLVQKDKRTNVYAPVQAEIVDSIMRVRGGNIAWTEYELADLSHFEVRGPDAGATAGLIVGGVVGLAVLLVIVASVTKDDQAC
jgi:hypothetical protein